MLKDDQCVLQRVALALSWAAADFIIASLIAPSDGQQNTNWRRRLAGHSFVMAALEADSAGNVAKRGWTLIRQVRRPRAQAGATPA